MPTTPDKSDKKEERTPFFSETDKKIYGWYAYTALMVFYMIGGIAAAVVSLTATVPSQPTGGLTLLWRIPLALGWSIWTLVVWYKIAKFWDPSDVAWVDTLLLKLRLRRR